MPRVSHSTFCKCILLSISISISHHTIEGDIEALHMASHHRCLLAAIAPPAAVNAIHANFYQFSPYYTYHIQYHTPFHIILIKVCNVCKSSKVRNLGSLACICSAGRCPSCSWYWRAPFFWPCMHLDRCLVNENGEAGTLLHMANATWFIFN